MYATEDQLSRYCESDGISKNLYFRLACLPASYIPPNLNMSVTVPAASSSNRLVIHFFAKRSPIIIICDKRSPLSESHCKGQRISQIFVSPSCKGRTRQGLLTFRRHIVTCFKAADMSLGPHSARRQARPLRPRARPSQSDGSLCVSYNSSFKLRHGGSVGRLARAAVRPPANRSLAGYSCRGRLPSRGPSYSCLPSRGPRRDRGPRPT